MTDGQRAFEAYRAYLNGLEQPGLDVPVWEMVGEAFKAAWEEAAAAVLEPTP